MNFSPYIFDSSEFDIDQKGRTALNPVLHAFQNIWSLKATKEVQEQQEFLKKFFISLKKLSESLSQIPS